MADIVIRGMEMPKNCWDCNCCDHGMEPECAILRRSFEEGLDAYENSRPSWCPLVTLQEWHSKEELFASVRTIKQFCEKSYSCGHCDGHAWCVAMRQRWTVSIQIGLSGVEALE